MSKQVVIVGGGVVGLCSAYYCLERGLQVTVVERLPAQRDGCSYGNAGLVVPSHFVPLAAPGMVALGLKWMGDPRSPFYIRPRLSPRLAAWGLRFCRACRPDRAARAEPLLRDLHLASRAAFEQLADRWENEFSLASKGSLMLCRSEHTWHEEAKLAERAVSLGVPAEVLDAAATAAREPDLRLDVVGSVYYPGDAHLVPQQFMAALESRLAERGCRFLWQTDVTGLVQRGRRVAIARTTRGDLAADEFVLAGGVWSRELARSLGLNLSLEPGKGYSLTLANPPRMPKHSAILTEARVAVTPMGSTVRFGGTMEIAGLDHQVRSERVAGIVQAATQYLPDFREQDFRDVAPWHGLRPVSPDGLPYLGYSRRYDNLIVAAGHAMLGISLGPITGQIVARLLSSEPAGFELSLLSPDRFGWR